MSELMKRREFITLLGGAAAAWPLAGRAQQGERVRRVGVLMYTTPDEPESQARITALAQGLQEAGWAVGRNLRIDVRWASGDLTRLRKDAADLVALRPDVIVAGVGPTTAPTTGDPRRADCDGPGRRPGRGRLCQEHCASGRQHHWFYPVRICFGRQMA